MNHFTKSAKHTSLLLTFPFWLIVDAASQPELIETAINCTKVRLYPPFRSGPANFIPMPFVNPHNVPFLPGAKPNIPPGYAMMSVAFAPKLGLDKDGKFNAFMSWGKEWASPLEQIPMDSMRIDVAASPTDPINQGRDLASRVLEWLRVLSGQWWINGSTAALLGYLRNVFECGALGEPLNDPTGNISFPPIKGDERLINAQTWRDAINRVVQNSRPSDSQLLLLDADYHLAAANLRFAIWCLCVALEQATEAAFERIWAAKNSTPFKRKKGMQGDGLPEYLSTDLERFCSRSLAKERADDYAKISALWVARGNAVHGGQLEYREQGKKIVVDRDIAKSFIIAAKASIEWLSTTP
jgi:hypothetical protein